MREFSNGLFSSLKEAGDTQSSREGNSLSFSTNTECLIYKRVNCILLKNKSDSMPGAPREQMDTIYSSESRFQNSWLKRRPQRKTVKSHLLWEHLKKSTPLQELFTGKHRFHQVAWWHITVMEVAPASFVELSFRKVSLLSYGGFSAAMSGWLWCSLNRRCFPVNSAITADSLDSLPK